MAVQSIDYKQVIADIERQRADMNAEFDAAIAALRRLIALQGIAKQPPLPGLRISARTETDRDGRPYRNLSMIDAAKTHLREAGGVVLNTILARELEAGGFEHKSKNFPNTLNSILWRRAKTVGDIRKSGRGWELAE